MTATELAHHSAGIKRVPRNTLLMLITEGKVVIQQMATPPWNTTSVITFSDPAIARKIVESEKSDSHRYKIATLSDLPVIGNDVIATKNEHVEIDPHCLQRLANSCHAANVKHISVIINGYQIDIKKRG